MADTTDDVSSAVDAAINAGGREEMYKDLTRKAANFLGAEDEREVEDMLKSKRRDAARQRRLSLRAAADRATSRQPR